MFQNQNTSKLLDFIELKFKQGELDESSIEQVIEKCKNLLASKRSNSSKRDNFIAEASEKIISYLNEKANTTFESASKKTQQLISARIEEGFGIDDFLKVIDKKTAHWKGSRSEKYLRPITLFSKTKFENYLNESDTINKNESKTSSFQSNRNAVEQAKKFDFGLGE